MRSDPAAQVFVVLLAAYAIGHAALRVWISPVLNIDDAREAIFSQTLAWGYEPRQPPLYTWLVWATVRLRGVSVASLTAAQVRAARRRLRVHLRVARLTLREPRLAPLAAFSLLLLLPDRLVRSRRPHPERRGAGGRRGHGLRAGPARDGPHGRALCVAGPRARRGHAVQAHLPRLRRGARAGGAEPRPVPAAPPGPPGDRHRRRWRRSCSCRTRSWLAAHEGDLVRLYLRQLGAGSARPFAAGVLDGLGAVLRAARLLRGADRSRVSRAVPGDLPPEVDGGPAGARRTARRAVEEPAGRLVERTLLAGLGLLGAGALLEHPGPAQVPLGHPALLPPAAVRVLATGSAGRRRRASPTPAERMPASWRSPRALMVTGILLQVRLGARLGVPSRLNTPYDAVATAVAAAGFRQGTIVAGQGPLGGNLRLAFPSSRVVSLEAPGYLPAPASRGSARPVSRGVGSGSAPRRCRRILRAYLRARLGAEVPGSLPIATVAAPHRHAPAVEYRAFYVHLPDGRRRTAGDGAAWPRGARARGGAGPRGRPPARGRAPESPRAASRHGTREPAGGDLRLAGGVRRSARGLHHPASSLVQLLEQRARLPRRGVRGAQASGPAPRPRGGRFVHLRLRPVPARP